MEKSKFVKGQLKTLIFGFLSKDRNRIKDLDKSYILFQKKHPKVTKTQFKDRVEMFQEENPEDRWAEFVNEPQKTEEKPQTVLKTEEVIKEELVLNEEETNLRKESRNEATISAYKKQVTDSIDRMSQQWSETMTPSQKNYLGVLDWNAKNAEKFLNINTEKNFRKQKLKFK